jgi:hypothetical protein
MRSKKIILASVAAPLVAATAFVAGTVKGSEPPGRLIDNGDGTVTDTVTKLVWQQATPGNSNQAACANACAGMSIGAFSSGWRLPTVKELISIVDYESPTQPAIDTVAFPATQSNWYWTSTDANGSAYVVHFGAGQISPTNPGNNWYYRCVHAAPAPPADAGGGG